MLFLSHKDRFHRCTTTRRSQFPCVSLRTAPKGGFVRPILVSYHRNPLDCEQERAIGYAWDSHPSFASALERSTGGDHPSAMLPSSSMRCTIGTTTRGKRESRDLRSNVGVCISVRVRALVDDRTVYELGGDRPGTGSDGEFLATRRHAVVKA